MSTKTNKNIYSSNTHLIILIIIIIVLIILAVFLPKSKNTIDNSVNNNSTQVEIIDGQGYLPNSSGVTNSQNNSNSPQQNPATVEDLGGNATTSGGIDNLLKDKDIQVNK